LAAYCKEHFVSSYMLSDIAAFEDVEYFTDVIESNVEIYDMNSIGHLICLHVYYCS